MSFGRLVMLGLAIVTVVAAGRWLLDALDGVHRDTGARSAVRAERDLASSWGDTLGVKVVFEGGAAGGTARPGRASRSAETGASLEAHGLLGELRRKLDDTARELLRGSVAPPAPQRAVVTVHADRQPLSTTSAAGSAGSLLPPSGDRVILYVARDCPPCERARRSLHAQGVPLEERDVTAPGAARAALLAQAGSAWHAVPTAVTAERVVIGFDRGALWQLARPLGAER